MRFCLVKVARNQDYDEASFGNRRNLHQVTAIHEVIHVHSLHRFTNLRIGRHLQRHIVSKIPDGCLHRATNALLLESNRMPLAVAFPSPDTIMTATSIISGL